MNYSYDLVSPGPRPPYYEVPYHLWGKNCSFDSDGDSYDPDTKEWTELYIARRRGPAGIVNEFERVEIDPVSLEPLKLRITSDDKNLARLTAEFLHEYSGGVLSELSEKDDSNKSSGNSKLIP